MKRVTQLFFAALLWLLFLFAPKGFCDQRVHCQWGPYGDRSECDGCTKTQLCWIFDVGSDPPLLQVASDSPASWFLVRVGVVSMICQFPLSLCGSQNLLPRVPGKCISQSLVCNGDQDCEEDGQDEQGCDVGKHIVSLHSVLPPNIELLGIGYHVLTGGRRASVINTKSQCGVIYSGVHNALYRLPLLSSTAFWLVTLETVNTYTGYFCKSKHQVNKKRHCICRVWPLFTQYFLRLTSVFCFPLTSCCFLASQSHQSHECVRTQRWILFFRISDRVHCTNSQGGWSSSTGNTRKNNLPQKVELEGGGTSQIAALKAIQLSDPDRNWEIYSNWADSVRSIPQVTKQTLRLLSELVKEVQCAGVKRLYLRRAIEQYLAESDTCHCRPCSNNGLVVRDGDECKCICKHGSSGVACEQGTEVEGQQGVIHGSWACWSDWSSCSGVKRSRSRSCSNPTPQNDGQHCIGESTEISECEDQDLQYLKLEQVEV
ncbi:complement component C7 [Plectropomus leopardus]|uniref:complement component C7 n=1 Tax=Plectropomus leopardus TaxID=160734 RepID=UPI001C4C2DAB|nr:complement component C7 [Plectropomus leopardus]